VLLVTLEQPWVVDVGFGDGFLEPLPLVEGSYRQGFMEYALSREGDRWTMHNHAMGSADRFDFTLAPRAMEAFGERCHELQTSPTSGFVLNTVCQRFVPDGLVTLRGVVLREVRASGVTETTIDSASAWARALLEYFGLAIPGVEALFPGVWARHLAWVAREADANAITSELPAVE
jgi:N-hydroxyarylamine O-acetyltransferase